MVNLLDAAGVPCGTCCVSRKQIRARNLRASAGDIHRWTRLHTSECGLAAAAEHRAQLQREAPPQQLTLCYQHVQRNVVEEARLEKRMRSRWSRMFLALRVAQGRKRRCAAIAELADLRAAPASESRSIPYPSDHEGAEDAVDSEASLAAQLGLDVATYRLLRQLEEREILPEDYDLLGRLDETVKSKTLSSVDLNRFETKTYVAQLVSSNVTTVGSFNNSTAEFGCDFWRMPLLCSLPEEVDPQFNKLDCKAFGADFWKLPLNSTEEDNHELSTTASEGDEQSYSVDLCGVCLVDFDNGDELRVLPCGHFFHRECIDHWLLNSSTVCPVDKRDMLLED